MYLLRTSLKLCLAAGIILLNACSSSMVGIQGDEGWNVVPKSYIEGLKAAKSGEYEQSAKLFSATIKVHPDFSPAYTNLGLQQLKLNDYKSAEDSFKKSIEINADNPISFHYLGVISRFNGDFVKAKEMYLKAIDLYSGYAVAHLNLGILFDLYLHDLEQSLVHYEKYQSLIDKKDDKVEKWIIDIKTQLKKSEKS